MPAPRAPQRRAPDAGILAFGSSDPAVIEARDILPESHGKDTDYLRIRALPFTDEVEAFLQDMEVVYVVEQNRDGQMANLFCETSIPELATKFKQRAPLRQHGHRRPDHRRSDHRLREVRRPMTTATATVPTNKLGLTKQDYVGAKSTLCAGCGHDAITAQIIQAAWEMGIEPHRVAKLSGIGCSSKTPTYFLSQAWGFNSRPRPRRLRLHRRRPGQPAASSTSSSAATAIPCPSAWASSST